MTENPAPVHRVQNPDQCEDPTKDLHRVTLHEGEFAPDKPNEGQTKTDDNNCNECFSHNDQEHNTPGGFHHQALYHKNYMPLEIFISGMETHFGIYPAKLFLDEVYIQRRREVKLDVLKFDEWLHQVHGEYEKDGLSMREAIEKFYGTEAAQFVEFFI